LLKLVVVIACSSGIASARGDDHLLLRFLFFRDSLGTLNMELDSTFVVFAFVERFLLPRLP